MQGLTKAMSRRVGAVAAAVLVTSSALAAGQMEATQPRTQSTELRTNAIAVATLGLPPIDPADLEPQLLINRLAPRPSDPVVETTIIGVASFYDIPGETASGEQYDPTAFTAAAQLEIRDKFGGIKFGRLYQPSYAVAEYDGKKLILKFNDVGPLVPGRKFDLSRAAMEYFDGIEKGLLQDLKVTVLPSGRSYTPGPVTDDELAAIGFGTVDTKLASVETTNPPEPSLEKSYVLASFASVEAARVPSAAPVMNIPFECENTTTADAPAQGFMVAWQDVMRVGGRVDESAGILHELNRREGSEARRSFDDDGHRDEVCANGAC